MPTGYTADVQSGKITDFQTFALRCARAFGALIELRDEPSDAPIPSKLGRSDHHSKALREAAGRLQALKSMSAAGAQRAANEANKEAEAAHERRVAEKKMQRDRYEAMLAKVSAWTPPSADHVDLRDFMLQQLRESIDFDCGGRDEAPAPLSGPDWLAREIKSAEWSVAYHKREQRKEDERYSGRQEWIDKLRSSLVP